MSRQAYPKYKPSGIEWLGEIPEHWKTCPVKRVSTRIQTGCTPPTSEERYYDDGTVPWYGPSSFGTNLVLSEPVKLLNEAAIHEGTARLFPADSIMVVCIGATIGKVGYLTNPASSNQQITAIILSPRKASGKFLSYQLKRLEHVLRGIAPSTTLPIMDQQEVGYLPCALPTLGEQHAIAAFLDRETARIDTLIAKKERQIELLQEKRAALISHAVTKGLDPNAKMKDSGIEWLRGIPEHWTVSRIATICSKITNGFVGPTRDILVPDGISYLQSLHIKGNNIQFDGLYFVEEGWSKEHGKSILRQGDVLVVQTGDIGQVAVVPEEFDGANCHALIILSCRKEYALGKFLSLVLNSHYGFHSLKRIQTGSLLPHLNCTFVREIYIPLPPFEEQKRIVTFLDHETTQIDLMTSRIEESITKLHEYRTALISAAVTGKIDVRKEAS
jgi:type I restriction enzyme S subunit